MNKKQSYLGVSLVVAGCTALSLPSHGQTLEERVKRLEQENREQAAAIEQQQKTIAAQKQALEGAPMRVQELERALEEKRVHYGGWFQNIDITGLIEVEASYVDPFEGTSESDITLATFELGIASQVNDWVQVVASLLYEQDETDLEVDLAFITIANPDLSPIFFTAGQLYVPFGAYQTNLLSDPLTLEIGEARETAAQIGFVHNGFSGSVYGFSGDNDVDGEQEIGSWGANLAFAMETGNLTWSAGAGYINDLGDSDSLADLISDNRGERYNTLYAEDPHTTFSMDPTERTGGWTANLAMVLGDFNVIAEYLTAADDFDPDSLSFKDQGAQPAAWNLELGYSFDLFGKEAVAAAAYQTTEQALALELPEERWLVGISVGIFDNTALSLEYSYDTDYGTSDGGTGETGSALVAQLAVEF
ncbi:LbtU family siderophore porin [Thiohalocapsa marina]|uniref:LbtU family siderophore porin n=1 Tax=Thiohalocapsa marina TaxID=424902 RepID=A0A5M8FTD3_9GAMM|nr:LbtU family siderophore porin [Thiohalocapsa marina]KAA6187046.1 LbtU family siderophore porin [Thiohalocapsa marina]